MFVIYYTVGGLGNLLRIGPWDRMRPCTENDYLDLGTLGIGIVAAKLRSSVLPPWRCIHIASETYSGFGYQIIGVNIVAAARRPQDPGTRRRNSFVLVSVGGNMSTPPGRTVVLLQ
jgi:hypothetical protein